MYSYEMHSLLKLLCIIPIFAFSESPRQKTASEIILAGGCFWCMEKPFEELEGVESVISGYSGGALKNPSYKQVASGQTKHREVVLIKFNSAKVSLDKILDVFWMQIDPTDSKGQFVDRGFQYSSAIYYTDASQKSAAELSKKRLIEKKVFKEKIATEILAAKTFYPAEEYHQDYYKKNPIRYKFYRARSGRDSFLKKHWKKKK